MTTAIDIKAKYDAKCGAPSAGSPKVFFKYFYVNTATGEKYGQSKYVDHKTVETMSREVSKIITEQIRHNIPVETKSSKPKSGSKK